MKKALLVLLCCSSCATFLAAPTPMTALHDELDGVARCLVVFLPGVGDEANDFVSHAHEHPEKVTGMLALAPYLGDAAIADEIRAAGGLASWQAPQQQQLSSSTYQREVWRWLQEITSSQQPKPNLSLGWGTEDRLAPSAELLAARLPAGHVFRVPGGHKWTSWKLVLDAFLADSDFARGCGSSS